jgi:microcompartment protein CcmL/EutN
MAGPFLQRIRHGATVKGPALGIVELSSIARGHVVADAMVKRAPVELVIARTISPGKYLVLATGDVADVNYAMAEARDVAGTLLVDQLELAQVAEALLAALGGKHAPHLLSLGIVECISVASTTLAADAACKAADVALAELHLADGIGGKGYFVITGEQSDVEAALAGAVGAIPAAQLTGQELIARPHDDFLHRFH